MRLERTEVEEEEDMVFDEMRLSREEKKKIIET